MTWQTEWILYEKGKNEIYLTYPSWRWPAGSDWETLGQPVCLLNLQETNLILPSKGSCSRGFLLVPTAVEATVPRERSKPKIYFLLPKIFLQAIPSKQQQIQYPRYSAIRLHCRFGKLNRVGYQHPHKPLHREFGFGKAAYRGPVRFLLKGRALITIWWEQIAKQRQRSLLADT